ncbi:chaperone protein dnaJ 72 [Amaranthus tricolor]|uniref:chaperone protein dnaJ 72 n=1 Tax=Amaranthus tricolor TaxID=29722 RepID=UPI0025870252|nr:chaperone protein dnaJ 72 [Amaranthus tricolor]
MADHYRLLGVTKSSSKEEIKEAFRKLAIQYHPDKHAQSSKSARDAATLKFKQVSEAYEVLVDDRKRAAYNLSRYNKNSSYSYHNNYDPNYYYRGGSYHRPPPFSSQPHRFMLNLDAFFRYMTTRAFLLNVAFAGLLLGGTVAIDMGGEALWKMQNPGKSFEEVMESIEKKKGHKGHE